MTARAARRRPAFARRALRLPRVFLLALCLPLALSGCMETTDGVEKVYPKTSEDQASPQEGEKIEIRPPSRAALTMYGLVAARILPTGQKVCRAQRAGRCNFVLALDDRAGEPANAYQTLDKFEKPVIIVTTKLLEDVRNADELAFIMAHEIAHHILGHLDKKINSARMSGLSAKVGAAAAGASEKELDAAWKRGVVDGILVYSKEFELQADALGAKIAYWAGFDALKGALYFNRIPNPRSKVNSTHPRNAQRLDVVRRTIAELAG